MEVVVAVFAALMGASMAVVWTKDIRAGRRFDASGGLLRARDLDSDALMAPHWFAELGTAALLVVSAVLLVAGAGIGPSLMLVALGALVYTSANSLSWALARTDRTAYAVPMLAGLVGGLLSIGVLLLGL